MMATYQLAWCTDPMPAQKIPSTTALNFGQFFVATTSSSNATTTKTHFASSSSSIIATPFNTIIMRISVLFLLATKLLQANAFAPPAITRSPPTALFEMKQLTDIDEMCIENVAELCLQADTALLAGECNLDEYEAIVNQLSDQKAILVKHVERIDNLLTRLQGEATDVDAEPYIPG